MLNVAFNVDKLNVNLGGTAGNIAYSLALLGEKPIIYATAGNDFRDYEMKLKSLELPTDDIRIFEDEKTAQAFITTDLADNQITAFHGGAMFRANEHPLVVGEKSFVIISPNDGRAMVDHAHYCRHHKLPFIFDPGQAFNALSGDQLVKSVHESKALVLNDYEWQLWKDKTSLSKIATLGLTETVIITKGEEGCRVVTTKEEFELPAVSDLQVVDPTGSGDAFRAGLLYGLSRGWELKKSAQIATVVASFCVEIQGTQSHEFDEEMFHGRYQEAWDDSF